MKRKPTPPAGRRPPAPRKRGEWVQYLPAIITATTALLEVLLRHFKP